MVQKNWQFIIGRFAAGKQLFFEDSLFRNAIFLMVSTAVMSVLGFVFWVFVAHLYDPADIGIASALISITTLLSNLSLLGINYGLVRFLSNSKKASSDINAAAIVVAGVTVLAGTVYALIITKFGGDVGLLNTPWHKLAFIVLLSAVSLNSLTDAVFIANRRGEYHTIGYATFGTFKLLLPLVLIPFGAVGIYGSYILAMLASLIISYYLMLRGCGYKFRTKPDWSLLKSMRRYASHNYVGVIVAGLPSQLMPLFIIKRLGAPSVAYFSMAWTMVNLLYVIPSAVSQSLLAESSFDSRKKSEHLKRTIRLLVLLLTPAVFLSILIAPFLINIFGSAYSQNGTSIFQILALSTFFMAINAVGNATLNIERRTGRIVMVQIIALLTTSISAFYLIRFGLIGVGFSFLIGNIISSMTLLVVLFALPKHLSTDQPFPTQDDELRQLLKPYGISDYTADVLGNGSNNCTIRISMPTRRLVIRIYQPDLVTDKDIKQEMSFMAFLATKEFRTPKVVAAIDGTRLMHCKLRGKSWQYLLMEYVSGNHPEVYSLSLLQSMARQQAIMHNKGIEFARTAGTYRRRIPRPLIIRQALLSLLAPAGYSHFDFDASNLLVDNDQINCVLDFEGMRYGPIVSCIFFTLSQIYKQQQSQQQLVQYIAAYERTRKLTQTEKLILSVSLACRYHNPALLRLNTVR